MKPLRVAEDVVSLERFKGQAARWLKHVSATGHPVVITQAGRPAGVLVGPEEFDLLWERGRFLESVARGLDDSEAGRTMTTADLKRRLSRRRGKARKS